ncbi:orotate phosphoribosyltransferase [Candidatus Tachikawaea gelatinosa]|uniref:Orotate phosphoribosyltransferase n=1 Tax=Candidatus Tachikawaea gelatinosa TaxID=1410383 RepID=A0A090BWJ1_9ENTR|nr:orotate phosphoribosyltransferase [Candidatus Tachikawaea gelatinosa]BAP58696.1 orotate phosphoribosyltransferase [Candidatus Tachikawaea gelatinosa]
MNNWKDDFIKFAISKKVLRFGKFFLKSGRISPYFFNIGALNNGKDLNILGEFYAKVLININVDFNLLFGAPYKGIISAIVTSMSLYNTYNRKVNYSFNRKEQKKHGEQGLLIGSSFQKKKIILIDDVITSGSSIKELINNVCNYKKTSIVGILIAFNRQEKKNNDFFVSSDTLQKYCIYSIITLNDVINYMQKNIEYNQELIAIDTYKKIYGL